MEFVAAPFTVRVRRGRIVRWLIAGTVLAALVPSTVFTVVVEIDVTVGTILGILPPR